MGFFSVRQEKSLCLNQQFILLFLSELQSKNIIHYINKLAGKIAEKGYTLVPLKVYIKGDLIKVEIGLARGKKLYDKRQDIAKKDQRREVEREFKVKNLY